MISSQKGYNVFIFEQKGDWHMFLILAGGLGIIIIAVIVAVVSSVSAAAAASEDIES